MGREFQVKVSMDVADLDDEATRASIRSLAREGAETLVSVGFFLDTDRVELVFTGTTKEQ
jgi:hypothetical protein